MKDLSNNQKLLIITTILIFGSVLLYSNKKTIVLDRTARIGNLIKKQFTLYPEMKTQDLYKFIHQASMGSEHAVKDIDGAIKWLKTELAEMDTVYQNNLYDNLTPGGNLVRVNLRPFRKLKYNPALLANAFVKTANQFKGSIDTLKYYCSVSVNLAEEGEIPLNKSEMIYFFEEKEKRGFPAVHHSNIYNKLYRPAYRVVAAEYLDFLKEKTPLSQNE